jgi:4-hydroxybenzoate polyprenyltransferase
VRKGEIGTLRTFLISLAHSNLLLAIGAALASFSGCVVVGLPLTDIIPFLIVFLITFSIYTLNRRTDIEEDTVNHPERLEFVKRHEKSLLTVAVLSYATALSLASLRNLETFLVSLLPIVVVGLYSLKWVPSRMRKRAKFSRLKELFIVKNCVVALTWASMMFVLVTYFSVSVTLAVIVMFLFLFVRFLINTIMFDLRDITGDKMFGIRTLPVTLNIRATKQVLYILNSFLGAFLIVSAFLGLASPLPLLLVNLSTLYSFWYIWLVGKTDPKILADIIVDGEYFVIAFLAFLAHVIILYA